MNIRAFKIALLLGAAVLLLAFSELSFGQGNPSGPPGGPPGGGGGGTSGGEPVGYFWRSRLDAGSSDVYPDTPPVSYTEYLYEGPSCEYFPNTNWLDGEVKFTFADDEAAAVLNEGEIIDVNISVKITYIRPDAGAGHPGTPNWYPGSASTNFNINGFEVISGNLGSAITPVGGTDSRDFQLKVTSGDASIGCSATLFTVGSFTSYVFWLPEPPKHTSNPGCVSCDLVCPTGDIGYPGLMTALGGPGQIGSDDCGSCPDSGGGRWRMQWWYLWLWIKWGGKGIQSDS